MKAPRFYSNALVSAELQINQWIKMLSELYGGFHGTNCVDIAVEDAFFDDVYMKAYIRHADGWDVVVPTSTTDEQTIRINGSSVTRDSVTEDNGIYSHVYTVPVSIEPGERYNIVVEVTDEDPTSPNVYTPYETLSSASYPTLNPFTSGAIPREFQSWNEVSDTLDILTDTVGLNSQGFTSTFDTIHNDGEVIHYLGTAVHSEPNLLFNFEIEKPEHNIPADEVCDHTYWSPACPDHRECWHDIPSNDGNCRQSGESDTWGTFSMVLQVEVPGSGVWTDIFRYHYLILDQEITSPEYTIDVIDAGYVAAGDYLENKLVTGVSGDTITVDTAFGTRQHYKSIKTTWDNSAEKVREFTDEFRHVEIQGNVELPTISEGDVYNVRLKTYDDSHEGSSHADLWVNYIGEVPSGTAMSSTWNGMKRWECGDNIGGETGRYLSEIIENVEYLAGFSPVNYGSPKLRDTSTSIHKALVFQREKRFLSYLLEPTEGHTEFEPTITYYNQAKAEWITDSLSTETDVWHVVDLDTIEGLYSGGFYTLKDLSYAIESGDNT